jgi:O-antigen/teichoic acid export membrane protein
MSRSKKFARSLLSGYLLVGVNIIYTLVTFPLGLHFLSTKQFGLWNAIIQMAGLNLIIVEMGMSGAISRILIDHKDEENSSNYGTIIVTGFFVLCVQAVLIVISGSVLSFWLPNWMKIPAEFFRIFRILLICQCIVLGVGYVGRIFGFILQAHQRYDICNYVSGGGLGLNLLILIASFKLGFGLYSLLLASVGSAIFNISFSGWAVHRFQLLPKKGYWGGPDRVAFKRLFFYGSEIFLLSIGQQLIFFSAVPIISRTQGLIAVTTWTGAIKIFNLAQQLVYRIADFSFGALAEMMVRGEQNRLQSRFRDIVGLTGCAAAMALVLALCNQSFLEVWTKGKVSWSPSNDLLMAISFFVYAMTRVPLGFVCMTKQIGWMKFVYVIEGITFVCAGLFCSRQWGFPGIISCGIITNLLFSGIYGAYRVGNFFSFGFRKFLREWIKRSLVLFLLSALIGSVFWALTEKLNPFWQLPINALGFGVIMVFLGWRIGLSGNLRAELLVSLEKLRARFRS